MSWASGGMADTLALGASEETREGSTPSSPREWRGRRSEVKAMRALRDFAGTQENFQEICE